MNKRSWLILMLGSVLGAPAVGVLLANHHEQMLIAQDPIRYDNFDLIRTGMTQADVEELMGCPSGVYGGTGVGTKMTACGVGNSLRCWQGTRGTIIVTFSDGKAWTPQFLRLVQPTDF